MVSLAFTFILEAVETLQFHRMASLHKIPTLPKVHLRNVKGTGKRTLWKMYMVKTPDAQAPGPQPALTDGGLTELLCSHLVGNVGAHQHTDVDAHLLPDDVRNELQPLRALVYALRWSRI